MTVYLDIYFAVNACADLLICCITAKVLHFKCTFQRLTAASLLGALISVADLFVRNALLNVLLGICTPALIILSAFGKTTPQNFMKAYIVIMGCSFSSGGIFFAAKALLERIPHPSVIFAASFAVFFFCFYFFDVFCFSSEIEYVDISVENGKQTKMLRLLCDSGCLVREPIGGLPVILLSPQAFDSIFPHTSDLHQTVRLKTRAVPVKTAAGSSVIRAVMPQSLFYIHHGKKIPCNAMLGRSNNESFAGHDGIFPKSLI
ncbi:MAG: sigma-E processing peptidase SpoIIGA [Clostridia bacterium]|nr:sigma-E processing peptidase SpoIIGA [Clostridia bacterium]